MKSELSSSLELDEDGTVSRLSCYTCECGSISMAILDDTQVICLDCMGIQLPLTCIFSTDTTQN